MVDPISMTIAAGLSLAKGLGDRQAAKSQSRRQAAMDMIAEIKNRAAIDSKNDTDRRLGERLLKEKETTTTTTESRDFGWRTNKETTNIDTAQDNYSFVDVEAMMQGAKDAGFNPATWLASGAMGAYTQTGSRAHTTSVSENVEEWSEGHTGKTKEVVQGKNAAAAYALMSPEAALVNAGQAALIPSTTSALADAGSAAFNVYRQDQAKQQSQDFQREMLGLQLDAINKANKSNGSGGTTGKTVNQGTPVTSTSGGATVSNGGTGGTGKTGGLSNVNNMPMDPQKIESINAFQKMFPWYKVDPTSPSGQAIEDHMGDSPLAWPMYAYKHANDLRYTLTGRTHQQELDLAAKNFQDAIHSPAAIYIKDGVTYYGKQMLDARAGNVDNNPDGAPMQLHNIGRK